MPIRLPQRRALRIASLGALSAAATLGPLLSRGAEGDGILVLRNGNVLKGDVIREGDQYRIDMPDARLRVPAAQVERHCQSLDEAYEQRRAARVGQSADAHLELARWCLRNAMLEHAAREVLDARTIDPTHPALPGIVEQLGSLLKAREKSSAPKTVVETAPAAENAGADSIKALPPAAAAGLSDATRAQFVRSIQPMLIHSCSTGGCHQVGSRHPLQLDRWALEGAGSAEIVRRNLAGVVSQLDAEDPASSPLIQWARQAHGGSAKSRPSTPLAPYQAALLLQWLYEASGAPPPMEETPADSRTASPGFRRPIPPSNIPGVDAALAAELEASYLEAVGDEPEKTAPANDGFVPRDKFDPEIFNRRFAGRAAQTKQQAAADESGDP